MLLNLRAQYSAGTTPRQTADAVITALSPAAWYRNATGVTSAGGFASQWDDYSGNTRHLVQAVGTNQPAYSAGVFTFDGADNFMSTTGWGLTQPEHIFAIFRQDSWTSGDTLWDGLVINRGKVSQAGTTPNLIVFAGGSSTSAINEAAIGTFGLMEVLFHGASSYVQFYGESAQTWTSAVSSMDGLTLGSAPSSAYGHASFKEFIIFPAQITGASLTTLLDALDALVSA